MPQKFSLKHYLKLLSIENNLKTITLEELLLRGTYFWVRKIASTDYGDRIMLNFYGNLKSECILPSKYQGSKSRHYECSNLFIMVHWGPLIIFMH